MARGSTSIRVGRDAPRGRAVPITRDTRYVRAQPFGARPLLNGRCPAGRSSGGDPFQRRARRTSSVSTGPALGFEHGTLRQHARLEVPPECDQELAGDCHNADAALPRATGGEARPVPARQRARRLATDPAPGELDRQRPESTLPALLIPCSRSRSPLERVVGVRPARPATCRRLRKPRHPKNSVV